VRLSDRRGRLRLHLEGNERELMTVLLDELEAVLAGDADPDDAVQQRLYPAAYRDDEAAADEYRELTETSLRTLRDERIGACRTDLSDGAVLDLADAEVGQRWIQVLNDLRLALGTRLGITEADSGELDENAADAQPRALYLWLTEVQDLMVHALMDRSG
jgi:hypothetical protein